MLCSSRPVSRPHRLASRASRLATRREGGSGLNPYPRRSIIVPPPGKHGAWRQPRAPGPSPLSCWSRDRRRSGTCARIEDVQGSEAGRALSRGGAAGLDRSTCELLCTGPLPALQHLVSSPSSPSTQSPCEPVQLEDGKVIARLEITQGSTETLLILRSTETLLTLRSTETLITLRSTETLITLGSTETLFTLRWTGTPITLRSTETAEHTAALNALQALDAVRALNAMKAHTAQLSKLKLRS